MGSGILAQAAAHKSVLLTSSKLFGARQKHNWKWCLTGIVFRRSHRANLGVARLIHSPLFMAVSKDSA